MNLIVIFSPVVNVSQTGVQWVKYCSPVRGKIKYILTEMCYFHIQHFIFFFETWSLISKNVCCRVCVEYVKNGVCDASACFFFPLKAVANTCKSFLCETGSVGKIRHVAWCLPSQTTLETTVKRQPQMTSLTFDSRWTCKLTTFFEKWLKIRIQLLTIWKLLSTSNL